MVAGPPKAPNRSESAAPKPAADGGFPFTRPAYGEIAVAGTFSRVFSMPGAARPGGLMPELLATDSLSFCCALTDGETGVTHPQPLTLTLTRVTPVRASRAALLFERIWRYRGATGGRNPLLR